MKVIVYTTGGTNRDAILLESLIFTNTNTPGSLVNFKQFLPFTIEIQTTSLTSPISLVRAIIETDLLKIFHPSWNLKFEGRG